MKKKLFSNKPFSKEKFKRLFEKEGFYVVLFLCIAIIATTAVYITRNNMDYFSQNNGEDKGITENMKDHEYFQPEDLQQDANMEENQEEGQEASAEAQNSEEVESTPTLSQNTEDKDNVNGQSATSILNKLVRPVEQDTITMDYSYQTSPVFSATLNEFRSDHQGIDIAAEKGAVVMAAMDGKVVDIQEDPRLGMLITIDHGHGIQTKYGNLDKEVEVTKNQQVKRGQTIGKAGNTAMFEIDDEDHIHFEVWKGDQCVDPKKYIKDFK